MQLGVDFGGQLFGGFRGGFFPVKNKINGTYKITEIILTYTLNLTHPCANCNAPGIVINPFNAAPKIRTLSKRCVFWAVTGLWVQSNKISKENTAMITATGRIKIDMN